MIVDKELITFRTVNQCETILGLELIIKRLADSDGLIQGRSQKFNAEEMAKDVRGVVLGELPPNRLTREYGIRQQALYLKSLL